jgi:hypothetical protein
MLLWFCLIPAPTAQGKWPQAVDATNAERMEKAYNIVAKMPQFEEERNQFLAVLRLLNAKVAPVQVLVGPRLCITVWAEAVVILELIPSV